MDPKSTIWCSGKLLHIVQTSALYDDAKTFVDLPARTNPAEISNAFLKELGDRTTMPVHELKAFVQKHFLKDGSDLPFINIRPKPAVPAEFLARFKSKTARKLIHDIHALWFSLTRQTGTSVPTEPDKHTLVPLPHPFVIPGDRFREAYYWDTYWSIEGMLRTGLVGIAKDIVSNLLHLAKTYGHVPNGNRIYYLNRSQPPLLSQMVLAVHSYAPDVDFIKNALPTLIAEHHYWSTGRKKVIIEAANGEIYQLTRYFSAWELPRPEAYRMDVELSDALPNPEDATQLYRDLSSCAESGWDFSSRWCSEIHPPGTDKTDLRTIRTTTTIPVDLNSYLFQMESNIAAFAGELGQQDVQKKFEAHAEARRTAMQALMWNENAGQWHDLLMTQVDGEGRFTQQEQIQRTYVANWVPLFCGVTGGDASQGKAAMEGLEKSGLLLPGGVCTSNHPSGQQWDYPNGWPPMQHMIIMGLDKYAGEQGAALAKDLAKRWLANCYVTYQQTGYFWEKYDVTQVGGKGGGGEYEVQKGFGWANGVIIHLLDKYGDEAVEGLDAGGNCTIA